MAERVKHVERNKEGVPVWDGDPTTFTEYSEMAGHWEQSVQYQKRYLCGPKLQAELTGSAKRFVMAMPPGWISHDGGVTRLLNHLRAHLGQPQLTEMSDFMARYFKNSRRRKHESMNDYITRKSELYMRACQSLNRVQQRYEPSKSKSSSPQGTSPAPSRPALTTDYLNSLDGDDDEDLGPDPAESTAGQAYDYDDAWASWGHRGSWNQSPDWYSKSWDKWTSSGRTPTPTYESVETYGIDHGFLPTFVQGWFLL